MDGCHTYTIVSLKFTYISNWLFRILNFDLTPDIQYKLKTSLADIKYDIRL